MPKSNLFSNLYFGLLILALATLPFTSLLNYFITPILLVIWILEKDFQRKWQTIKTNKWTWMIVLPALIWLINFVGLSYSQDLLIGLARTYDKLSFIVYPLVLLTLNKDYLSKKKWESLMIVFLASTTLMLLSSWGIAFFKYYKTLDSGVFFYSNFACFLHHPAYATLVCTIAFSISIYFLTISKTKNQLKLVSLLVFLAVSIYFYQTRAGFLAFGVIVFISLYYLYINKMKRVCFGFLITFIFCITTIYLSFPNRFENAIQPTENETFEIKSVKSKLGERARVWDYSWNITKQHLPFGVGSGYDINLVMNKEEAQFFGNKSKFINAHNQFLQSMVDHGIFGVIFLLAFLIYSCYYAIKTRNFLLVCLFLAILINICFESMFERSQGIFPFMLFYVLFLIKKPIFATASKEDNNEALKEKIN